MLLCALEIGKHRKVLVWLHENDSVYPSMAYWKEKILEDLSSSELHLHFCAVSDVARKNFIRNVKKCDIGLLPYGILDFYEHTEMEKKEKLTFASVGTICPIKQQMLYLKAIRQLDEIY